MNSKEAAPDVLHFLAPNDTLHSLSMAYGVPLAALRTTNNVFADNLLQGRKTMLIPGEFYKAGVSLSPQPIDGQEQEEKKTKLRRFMVVCKVAQYEVAELYLEQAGYDLSLAIQAYKDDEAWEKEHPQAGLQSTSNPNKGRSAGMRRFVGHS